MTLLVALPMAVLGGWWLSSSIWWTLWSALKTERPHAERPLWASTRWFVWSAFIPFASSAILLMMVADQFSSPVWFILLGLYWIGGGNLLMMFGERIPGIGYRFAPALTVLRQRYPDWIRALAGWKGDRPQPRDISVER